MDYLSPLSGESINFKIKDQEPSCIGLFQIVMKRAVQNGIL